MPLLIPHEHGAYGQLGFPLAAALAAGRLTAAAVLIAIACVAAFVAHEPALVLLGRRGPRARRELAATARITLLAAGSVALAAGPAGAWLLDPSLRWTLLVPGALALAAIPVVAWRAQRTTAGELHAAVTLSSVALPVGAAATLPPPQGALCALVFAIGFSAATLAVRGTIAVQRRDPSAGLRLAAVALAILAPVLVRIASQALAGHMLAWLAALPLSVLAVVFAVAPPSARHLRRVGWGLVGASAAATAALILLLRA